MMLENVRRNGISQEMVESGWWRDSVILVSPQGASIDNPAEEISKLRNSMSVASVIAERTPFALGEGCDNGDLVHRTGFMGRFGSRKSTRGLLETKDRSKIGGSAAVDCRRA
jgi:hypothetical protein